MPYVFINFLSQCNQTKIISYRNLKNINFEQLQNVIFEKFKPLSTKIDVEEQVKLYNHALAEIFDQAAPPITKNSSSQ